MLPAALAYLPSLVAGLRLVVATLPSGDVERALFVEAGGGLKAIVERRSSRTDVVTYRRENLPKGRYTWRIEEVRRSVLMAPPGQPTGVVRRAYEVSGWVDLSRRATDPPRPTQAFRFYAPTREQAEALRERLRAALRP